MHMERALLTELNKCGKGYIEGTIYGGDCMRITVL